MAAKKIALFIDADNISARFGKQIIDTLEGRGEIFIRRIYGNWEKTSLHSWNECILNFSLRAIQQPDYVAGKNATDMSLAIDAMDVLYGGKAEIFVLVSNDSDFTPLAIRLREGGMKIIGMGNAQAANAFRLACDEFIDLDSLAEVKLPSASKKKSQLSDKDSSVQLNLFSEEKIAIEPPAQIEQKFSMPVKVQTAEKISPMSVVTTGSKVISISDSQLQNERGKKIQQIHDILLNAPKLHGDENSFLLLNFAGQEIKSKNLGFTVRDFGYNTLQDFVSAFPSLYEVIRRANGVCYRCLKLNPKSSETDDKKLQRIHAILRETTKTPGDAEGFVNLGCAGTAIANQNLSIKGSGHSTLSKFISAFPNLYELKESGGAFFYRCVDDKPKNPVANDKLRQIHEILRETAKAHGDTSGLVHLSYAGESIGKHNLSIKDSGYSSWSKFISAFPQLYEVKSNGGAFYYRCK